MKTVVSDKTKLLLKLFNKLDGGLAYLSAERNEEQEITDFCFELVNDTAKQLLLPDNPQFKLRQKGLFEVALPALQQQFYTLKKVVEQDINPQFNFLLWPQNAQLSAKKLDDGIILQWTIPIQKESTPLETVAENKLLELLFNLSIVEIRVLKPVYNGEQEIIDFEYVKVTRREGNSDGWSEQGIVGKRLLEVYPGVVKTPLFGILKNTYKTGDSYQDVIFYGEDQLNNWYEVNYARYENFLLISRIDVTERKQAEQELQASEEKFRALAENTPDLVVRLDKNYRYLYANQKPHKEQLGIEADFLIGKTPADLGYPEENVRKYYADLDRVFQGETLDYFTDVDMGNHILYLHTILAPELDDNGNVKSALSITRDVTVLRKIEEELRNSEEKWRSLVQHTPNVVLRLTPDLKYEFVNPAIIKETGLPPEYFIGKGLHEVGLPEQEVSEFAQSIKEAIRTKELQKHRFEMVTNIGFRAGISYIMPELNSKGEVLSVLVITHNITELVRRKNLLRKQKRELELTNKELEAFTYSVSHDLRSPLRAIIGFSRKLSRETAESDLSEEGNRFLKVIQRNAARMATLIDDLLNFTRVSRTEMRKSKLSLGPIFRTEFYRLREEKKLENVRFSVQKTMPPVYADRQMMKQVVANLLSNAIKYSIHKNTAKIRVGAEEKDGQWVYFIKDNGIGFRPEYKEKIFEVFNRLHAQDEYEGVGIGLAIVRQILQKHEADIWAESKLGEGATFYFTLPNTGKSQTK